MTAQGLEQWDLTSKNASYLDRHMMFPLLEYLDGLIESDKISYSSKDVAAARLSLLRPTHMVDYAIDIYKSVHGDSAEIPEEMQAQKTEVFKQLEELQAGCKPLTEICDNEEEKVSPLRLSSLYLSIPVCRRRYSKCVSFSAFPHNYLFCSFVGTIDQACIEWKVETCFIVRDQL